MGSETVRRATGQESLIEGSVGLARALRRWRLAGPGHRHSGLGAD